MTRPWQDHRDEIARRLAEAPHRLVFSDFDGTLAPIVNDPGQAEMSATLRDTLAALAGSPRVHVGIVSGRAMDDIKRRVGLPKLIYAGNHGFEISGAGIDFVEPTAAGLRPELQSLARRMEIELRKVAGTRLENKGLTLSVHFREVKPELHDTVRDIVHRNVAAHGDRFVDLKGLMIREVRPQAPWGKGAAISWIKNRLRQPAAVIVFVGDDITDEDAFASFPGEIMVRVGTAGPSAANFHIENSTGVPDFFEWVSRHCAAG
jgi:trehalose 6-phosphate phosphatase